MRTVEKSSRSIICMMQFIIHISILAKFKTESIFILTSQRNHHNHKLFCTQIKMVSYFETTVAKLKKLKKFCSWMMKRDSRWWRKRMCRKTSRIFVMFIYTFRYIMNGKKVSRHVNLLFQLHAVGSKERLNRKNLK